jgi:exopolysaccharide biosynthesis polyprenyl glycosylphosphotransferase
MGDRWSIINKLAQYQFLNRFVLRWVLDFIEISLVLVSLPLASLLLRETAFLVNLSYEPNLQQSFFYSIFLIAFWLGISQVSLMATSPRSQRFLNLAFLFIRGYFFILILLVVIKFVFRLNYIPWIFVLINVGFAFLMTLSFRIVSLYFLREYRASGYNQRRVIIIGDESASFVIETFQAQKDWGYMILGAVTQSRKIRRKYSQDFPILPGYESLDYILESQVVDEVFYCKKTIDESELRLIMRICDEIGVIFRVQSQCSYLAPEPMVMKTLSRNRDLTLVDLPAHSLSYEIKSISDFIFSLFGLIILSPFLLLISLLIKLESKGPVLYKQERIGLRGRKFKLLKFRTMVTNAEQFQEKLQAFNEVDGPVFKIKNDPRITRLGKILRKTGIDEIPQLINVVRGEMSLIGPRPPVESEVKQYQRWHLRRLSVKPGITCTWQVQRNRNDIKFDNWMKMDLNYIDNWSLKKDFLLVFKTISAMVFATGR